MLYYTFIEPLYQRHYLGKRIYYRNNDLRKLSDEIGSFKAIVVECTDLEEFFEHITDINKASNCAIILGKPKGISPGETFQIRSEKWFKKQLGETERKNILGVYEFNNKKVLARLKKNFEHSRIVLFDYDPDGYTPLQHVYRTTEEYVNALSSLFEGFSDSGFVVTGSSSAGLMSPKGEYLTSHSPKRHAFFEVDDPSDIPRFRDALIYQAIKQDACWQIKDKKGKILTRYLFDISTFSPQGIVYEGKPQLNNGITQNREAPRYVAGRVLDTRLLSNPTELGTQGGPSRERHWASASQGQHHRRDSLHLRLVQHERTSPQAE